MAERYSEHISCSCKTLSATTAEQRRQLKTSFTAVAFEDRLSIHTEMPDACTENMDVTGKLQRELVGIRIRINLKKFVVVK